MSDRMINVLPCMREMCGTTVNLFGWDLTGTVSYSFNQQGFRSTVDYDFDPDYVFFGCSLVFGVGVDQDKIFPSQFERSWNCGLAGWYNNQDIFDSIQNFETAVSRSCRKFVCWIDRDNDVAHRYAQQLSAKGYLQFFCGAPAELENCYAMPPHIDTDPSGTHMGAQSHRMFAKLLCALFDRS